MLAGDVVAPHDVADPLGPLLPVVGLRGMSPGALPVSPAHGSLPSNRLEARSLPHFRTRKAANGLG